MRKHPNYVCRVTDAEKHIGRAHLSRFQELETDEPIILTTSQMLTTGMDAPTCKNIALARIVGSMTDFKQIIGRGTRVRDDYGKLFFNILDYTGSATRLFADPDFDGDPIIEVKEVIDEEAQSSPPKPKWSGPKNRPGTMTRPTPAATARTPEAMVRAMGEGTARGSFMWTAATSKSSPMSFTNWTPTANSCAS